MVECGVLELGQIQCEDRVFQTQVWLVRERGCSRFVGIFAVPKRGRFPHLTTLVPERDGFARNNAGTMLARVLSQTVPLFTHSFSQ